MSILEVELFSNEYALVTGAASNIGRAIATQLANEGAQVILTDVNEQLLTTVVNDISTTTTIKPRAIAADLSSHTGWHSVWNFVKDIPLAMFVHAACPKRRETDLPLSVSEKTFDAMLNTNVRSGFLLGREIAKKMRDDKVAGRLLYLTSLHATEPRNLPHYSASKAGMTMLVKELARELGPAGIRVNGIAPGAIPGGGFTTSEDSFQPKRKIPLGRFGQADDIARAAMALLSNDFMAYVTGTTLIVDGGLQLFNWIDFAYK